MINDSYKTIEKEAVTEFTEKKSLFISTIRPIGTEEEAKEFIEALRQKYSDATHNVYAYINREGNASRFSDDNEPQGTAGLPVYEVLRREELTGVCVVVTRYFGGILLGAGGLVRAYARGAKDAVDAAGVCLYTRKCCMYLEADYDLSGKVLRELEKLGIEPMEKAYEERVKVRFLCDLQEKDKVCATLLDATGARVRVEQTGFCYAK